MTLDPLNQLKNPVKFKNIVRPSMIRSDAKKKINDLVSKSQWLRKEVFEMAVRTGQGHLASVLSQIEIVIALYYGGVMRYTYGDPYDPNRDRLIISKGHATMGLYPILADLEYFSPDELGRYGTQDGLLKIFGNTSIPGIEATTGSLGHGIGIACGFCKAAKTIWTSLRFFRGMGVGYVCCT